MSSKCQPPGGGSCRWRRLWSVLLGSRSWLTEARMWAWERSTRRGRKDTTMVMQNPMRVLGAGVRAGGPGPQLSGHRSSGRCGGVFQKPCGRSTTPPLGWAGGRRWARHCLPGQHWSLGSWAQGNAAGSRWTHSSA